MPVAHRYVLKSMQMPRFCFFTVFLIPLLMIHLLVLSVPATYFAFVTLRSCGLMLSWKIRSIPFKCWRQLERGILAFGWLFSKVGHCQDSRFGSSLGHRGSDGLQNYKYFIIIIMDSRHSRSRNEYLILLPWWAVDVVRRSLPSRNCKTVLFWNSIPQSCPGPAEEWAKHQDLFHWLFVVLLQHVSNPGILTVLLEEFCPLELLVGASLRPGLLLPVFLLH